MKAIVAVAGEAITLETTWQTTLWGVGGEYLFDHEGVLPLKARILN